MRVGRAEVGHGRAALPLRVAPSVARQHAAAAAAAEREDEAVGRAGEAAQPEVGDLDRERELARGGVLGRRSGGAQVQREEQDGQQKQRSRRCGHGAKGGSGAWRGGFGVRVVAG